MEAIANFKEMVKRMIGLRKHTDKIENCQTSLEERLMTLGARAKPNTLVYCYFEKRYGSDWKPGD
jgi:hypothetical protein